MKMGILVHDFAQLNAQRTKSNVANPKLILAAFKTIFVFTKALMTTLIFAMDFVRFNVRILSSFVPDQTLWRVVRLPQNAFQNKKITKTIFV